LLISSLLCSLKVLTILYNSGKFDNGVLAMALCTSNPTFFNLSSNFVKRAQTVLYQIIVSLAEGSKCLWGQPSRYQANFASFVKSFFVFDIPSYKSLNHVLVAHSLIGTVSFLPKI